MRASRIRMRWAIAAAVAALGLVLFTGASCSRYTLLDAALWPLSRAGPAPPFDDGWQVLAGDLHCHVTPPDSYGHVVRDLDETLDEASEAGLDFLVLTPHVWEGFERDPARREAVLEAFRAIGARTQGRQVGDPAVVLGLEYSTRYGHLGLSFADLEAVLADVSASDAVRDPLAFFEAYEARGGFLVVNHPLTVPLDSWVPSADWDLSWKPWTRTRETPAYIEALDARAEGWEAYNVIVDELRDRFLQLDARASSRAVLARLDDEIVRRKRRMTPVGGSDSHSSDLRPTTFVLARERSLDAIREGLKAGRVCVGHPSACSLRVKGPDGAWVPPGGALAVAVGGRLEVALAGPGEVLLNGDVAAVLDADEGQATTTLIEVPDGDCHVVRAVTEEGASGPVYLGCALEAP